MTPPTRHFTPHLLRRVLDVFLAFAFAVLLPAQSPNPPLARPPQPAPVGPYRIAGTLVNAITGEPVRRATVEVLSEENSRTVQSASSDGDGRFSLDHLPAAKYQLTASKRGFRTAFYDEHDEFSTAIVTGPDQETSHLVFRLTPGAILRGVISGDGGDVVEGARVMLFKRPLHPLQGERTTQADAANTDDSGAYEFSNLSAGEYLLAVVAEPWYALHGTQGPPRPRLAASPANTELDVVYPVSYFDSTTEESGATPIVLAPGAHDEANMTLHAVPALHFSIAVPHRPDGSVSHAELRQTVFGVDVADRGSDFSSIRQDETMEFSGVAPGHYELVQGEPARVVDLELNSSQQVEVNGGTPSHAINGLLQNASGKPFTADLSLTLNRIDQGRGQNLYATIAHRDGRFVFEAVTPGSFTLTAILGNRILPIVSSGSSAAQHAGNILTLRDRPLNLVVNVSEIATRVDGVARRDGKGIAGVMVVLLPKDPQAWPALTRRDQSDSDGTFTLRDVAPGQYTLVAIADGWALDWSRPAQMARYLPQGSAVTVTDRSGAFLHLASPVIVQAR